MKIFTTRVKSKTSKFAMKTGVLLIWLLIWQLIYLFVDQELLISSPIDIFIRIVELSFTTLFWKSIGISFMRIFVGLILALVSGTILAVITAKFKILDYFFKPVLNIIKSTPVASFIILALIWLKSYRISAFIAFLMVLPMVWENVSEGIKNTDIKLLEMTKVFNIPKKRVLKAVYIPSIMPYFATACNVGIGFAWKAGIAAEVIGLSKGTIGRNLYNAKIYLETVDIFAWTVVVVILSLLFEKGFVKVINFLFKKAGIMYDYI